MHFPFELDLILRLQSLSNGLFDFFFNAVSFFGEETFIIALIGFTYWCYNKKMGEYIGFALTVSYPFNNFLKDLFVAPRPFEVSTDVVNMRPDTATGHAFPSGHVQGTASAFTALACWIKRRWMTILASIMIFLMMMSRMYLGVHFLSDVVAGALIGVIVSIVTFFVFKKYSSTNEKKLHTIYLATSTIFLVIALFMKSEDFFKGYGILIGFVAAVLFEKRYVKFSTNVSTIKKVIRFAPIIGVVPTIANILHLIRYAAIAFAGFGLYPHFFKKFNF